LRPIDKLTIGLSYDGRFDYGGDLNGGMLDVTYDATKELQVAAGMTYDVFNRDFFPSSTGTQHASVYWVGGKYRFAKNMSAYLRIEDLVTDARESSDVQGRFVFNYDF
jgi:predicted porin